MWKYYERSQKSIRCLKIWKYYERSQQSIRCLFLDLRKYVSAIFSANVIINHQTISYSLMISKSLEIPFLTFFIHSILTLSSYFELFRFRLADFSWSLFVCQLDMLVYLDNFSFKEHRVMQKPILIILLMAFAF